MEFGQKIGRLASRPRYSSGHGLMYIEYLKKNSFCAHFMSSLFVHLFTVTFPIFFFGFPRFWWTHYHWNLNVYTPLNSLTYKCVIEIHHSFIEIQKTVKKNSKFKDLINNKQAFEMHLTKKILVTFLLSNISYPYKVLSVVFL